MGESRKAHFQFPITNFNSLDIGNEELGIWTMITLIAEPDYSSKAIAKYRKLGPVFFWFGSSLRERKKILQKAELLVVRLALTADKKFIDSMPRLKIIATSTTGLNHIDTVYAAKKGIRVVSLRGQTGFLKQIPSTAEETFGLLLALVRKIPWAFDDVKSGKWRTNQWVGIQLYGKVFGIVGFGRLGRIVARFARAFGMRVMAADPYVSAVVMKKSGVKKVSLASLFQESDIISLHVPLTEKTHALITQKHFRAMKPRAYFLNTARAELIKRGALVAALKKKWIAGAAVDVLDNEDASGRHLKKDPLVAYAKKYSNCIIVPHIGGTTHEAKETTQIFLADLVIREIRMRSIQ